MPAYSLKGFKHSQFAGRQPRCNSQMPAAEPEYLPPGSNAAGDAAGERLGAKLTGLPLFFFFFLMFPTFYHFHDKTELNLRQRTFRQGGQSHHWALDGSLQESSMSEV